MRLVLTIAGGPRAGKSEQPDNACFTDCGGTIGRASNNDWVLSDASQKVSRYHATIHFLGGGFYIRDTSANGTGINNPDTLVAADTLQRLEDGQRLYIGPYRIGVCIDADVMTVADADQTSLQNAEPAVAAGVSRPTRFAQRSTPGSDVDAAAAQQEPLRRLLREAGLSADLVTAERAGEVGRILHMAVQVVVDLLRERMAFRNELRLPMTTIAGLETNPLKLSTDAQDALHNLLVKDNPDYLDATAAFASAQADLHIHHAALMDGLREVHNAMLTRFDPDALETQFRQHSGWRLGGAKALRRRAWKYYRDYFALLEGAQEGGFGRQFQEAFARGYEARLALGRAQQKQAGRGRKGQAHGGH